MFIMFDFDYLYFLVGGDEYNDLVGVKMNCRCREIKSRIRRKYIYMVKIVYCKVSILC